MKIFKINNITKYYFNHKKNIVNKYGYNNANCLINKIYIKILKIMLESLLKPDKLIYNMIYIKDSMEYITLLLYNNINVFKFYNNMNKI